MVCLDSELVVRKDYSDSECSWRIGGLICRCLLCTLASQGFSFEIHLTFRAEGEPQELIEQKSLCTEIV